MDKPTEDKDEATPVYDTGWVDSDVYADMDIKMYVRYKLTHEEQPSLWEIIKSFFKR